MTETKIEIKEGINPKTYFPDAKHIITYAFSIGDRHFFRFDDYFNIPYDRALKTLVYYKEMDMNCDRAFLTAHTEAFDNVYTQNLITIDELLTLRTLNNQIKQRLAMPKEPDLMYKLAAVVFFDQNESPATYEFKYGEQKILFWKEQAILEDFFLQKPLLELIPYLKDAGENLGMFSGVAQRQTAAHLSELLPMLSGESKNLMQSRLESLEATLREQSMG